MMFFFSHWGHMPVAVFVHENEIERTLSLSIKLLNYFSPVEPTYGKTLCYISCLRGSMRPDSCILSRSSCRALANSYLPHELHSQQQLDLVTVSNP
jgi:hypothetical protein